MIKLNNKNITYVALADSNNSLKAPKEIWYADSNNSVKLVYRRKDALIEGEDYEKYQWLVTEIPKGDFMNLPLNTSNFSFKRIFCDMLNVSYFWSKDALYGYHHSIYHNRIYDIKNANNYWVSSTLTSINNEITISSTSEALEINGEEVPQVDYPPSIIRFRNANSPAATSVFKTSSITVDSIERYIPCKLLKPVPKWLDANGIRRQVGECGMIDLVSGKFYGNVNSVGTFTVENYYERKEWLVGDGEAYIDTLRPNELNDVIRFKSNVKDLVGIKGVFGNHIFTNNRQSCFFVTYNEDSFATRIFQQNPEIYPSRTDDIEVQINQDKVIVNGTDYSIERSGSISNYSMPIFTRRIVTIEGDNIVQEIAKLSLNYFAIDGVMQLIPCTLTMDLPASMDANNIARTKGTSGMWDLVSDRFYGNVANSGTFKAVNLAEGVDYEVHQWLGSASGTPYLKVQDGVNTDENAYVETTYKCNYSNAGADIMIGFSINESNNIGIRIFNSAYNGGTTYVDYHKTVNGVLSSFRAVKKQDNINAERYIKATFDKLIIDNSEYQISFGNGFDNIKNYSTRLHCNANNNAVRYKRTKIRVNNVEYDLIPVKLLRPIPSTYDANGIARQAGECGMYDTVNDVFYGNVASSGTFSVSDDS